MANRDRWLIFLAAFLALAAMVAVPLVARSA